MENFLTGWDIWLVNSMCLVASYLWYRLYELLCYRKTLRASTPAAIQVQGHFILARLTLVNYLEDC